MSSATQELSCHIARSVLSQDKVLDPEAVLLFKQVFLRTLGWTLLAEEEGGRLPTEAERLRIVPLVFVLMPSRALVRVKRDERIKPHIREHLASIGLQPDERLIDIVKAVAD